MRINLAFPSLHKKVKTQLINLFLSLSEISWLRLFYFIWSLHLIAAVASLRPQSSGPSVCIKPNLSLEWFPFKDADENCEKQSLI